jgi:hypothetical protein
MTQFSDQLSAVRQAQFEAQLDFFRTFTTRALDSAGQLAALNVRTSRASVEQAAGTVKQLLEVRDPRDLFALGSAAQGQLNALFSYGRELAGIAAGARTLSTPLPIPLLAAPAPTANVPTSYAQVIEQASIATDAATTISGEIAAAAVDIGAAHAEAAIESAIADDLPPAEPTALAKALNKVSPKPASAGHPLASTVPLEASEGQVELPQVTPPESIAPVIAPPPKASRSSRRK